MLRPLLYALAIFFLLTLVARLLQKRGTRLVEQRDLAALLARRLIETAPAAAIEVQAASQAASRVLVGPSRGEILVEVVLCDRNAAMLAGIEDDLADVELRLHRGRYCFHCGPDTRRAAELATRLITIPWSLKPDAKVRMRMVWPPTHWGRP